MIAPGEAGRPTETRREAAVCSASGLIFELVEIESSPGSGEAAWYAIRAWRTGGGRYPCDVVAPLNLAQAGVLWREATGGLELGDGERAVIERDLRRVEARPSRRSLRARRGVLAAALVAGAFGALLASIWAVGAGLVWTPALGTLAAFGALWWAEIVERGGKW